MGLERRRINSIELARAVTKNLNLLARSGCAHDDVFVLRQVWITRLLQIDCSLFLSNE